jgi:predicted metal-dependent hydrolase
MLGMMRFIVWRVILDLHTHVRPGIPQRLLPVTVGLFLPRHHPWLHTDVLQLEQRWLSTLA